MSEKKNPLFEKAKNSKVNRATVVSVSMLLIATLVIVGVTLAANRSKRNELPKVDPSDTQNSTSVPETKVPEETTGKVEETKPAESEPSKPTSDQLPSFVLPVK